MQKKKKNKIARILSSIVYYCFAQYLPDSYSPVFGKISNKIRILCCKHIFLYCSSNVSNINRKVFFGKGSEIEIGDYSSIGANSILHPKVKIGKYVMMGPNVYMVGNNHIAIDINIPMCFQGKEENQVIEIGDDCWIGANVMIMAGKIIGHGSILAAGAVVTKNVEPYSVMGGNPAKLIKKRTGDSNDAK